jgi:thioesterase domain-containing protein/acyl carrier protein
MEVASSSLFELRKALEKTLPPQFLPAQIIPLASLPLSPNGKVDRARLPAPSDVSIPSSRKSSSPSTDIERQMAAMWGELLHQTEIGVRDSFFELGGHSLLAVRMLQRVADEMGKSVSLRSFYDEPTIEAVANFVARHASVAREDQLPPPLVVRCSRDGLAPLFYLNGQPQGGGKYARRLEPFLPLNRGLYIVSVPIFERPVTVEKLASRMVELIREEQPAGPYIVGGNCFGATLAFEIAHQLRDSGETVALLVMIHPDARTPMHLGFRAMRRAVLLAGIDEHFHFAQFSGAIDYTARAVKEIWREQRRSSAEQRRERVAHAVRWLGDVAAKHVRRPLTTWSLLRSRLARELDEQIQEESRRQDCAAAQVDPDGDRTSQIQLEAHTRFMSDAWTNYCPRLYDGRVSIIWPLDGPANPPWNPTALWARLTPDLEWHFVPGNHWTMLHQHFEHCARALGAAIGSMRNG